jgi:hypothetical protein
MSTAIGTYVRFLEKDGSAPLSPYNVQNFHQGESRFYDQVEYLFGAFGFSGSTVDADAANVEATLVMQLNELNLNYATTAANNFYLAQVRTVWLDPDTLEETTLRLEELYMVVGFDHDNSRLNIRLGNSLDAFSANVPRRRLTQEMVGALPSTGNISFT